MILPLLAVTTGSLNYWGNREVLDQAWASLFGQVFLFYGMFYLSMGVGLLAAAAWRMEHQGTNWNLLRTNTSNALSLILCKIVVIIIPVAFMQIILLAGTWIVGLFIVDNGTADAGQPPVMYLVAGLLAVLVAVLRTTQILCHAGGDLLPRVRRWNHRGNGSHAHWHHRVCDASRYCYPHAQHRIRLHRRRQRPGNRRSLTVVCCGYHRHCGGCFPEIHQDAQHVGAYQRPSSRTIVCYGVVRGWGVVERRLAGVEAHCD